MTQESVKLREFVERIDLSGTRRPVVQMSANDPKGQVFEESRDQARLVGSSVFSFVKGVTPEVREAISNSALLAQLVANKHASSATAQMDWYDKYLEVLANIGWVVQSSGWQEYTDDGVDADVHQKALEILAIALGPSAAAATIVKSAIDAITAMQSDSGWIKLFKRESERASITRFQIGIVEDDKDRSRDDGVMVRLLACRIEANKTFTQVLLVKYRSEGASFKANVTEVSINKSSLRELRGDIQKKVRAYQQSYLSSILDL
jgi:hypothetical protein